MYTLRVLITPKFFFYFYFFKFFILYLYKMIESERGEWKSWLKIQHSENQDHGIWSHYFVENRWDTMETVTDFIFLGSKITADGDCSHEIERHLLLGRKAMTNQDNVLKNRDITLLTKVHLVKAMVFPVVNVWIWDLDHKKSERQRTNAF